MMPATFAERLTVSPTAEGYQIRQEIASGKSCCFRLLYFWDFDAALGISIRREKLVRAVNLSKEEARHLWNQANTHILPRPAGRGSSG